MIGERLTPMVKALLLINIGIFLLSILTNFNMVYDFMALRYIGGSEFRPHQIFTYMFMHSSWMHLIGNMIGLFVFGPLLEKVWGANKFLIFYIVCGIGGAICSNFVNYYQNQKIEKRIEVYNQDPNLQDYRIIIERDFERIYVNNPNYYGFTSFITDFKNNPDNEILKNESKKILNDLFKGKKNSSTTGASGSVFGIMLGFALLFPNLILRLLFPPISIQAKYLVTIYALFEIYSLIQNNPKDTVSHIAHIGGMLFGYILILFWQKNRNNFY